jgi:hypothetical protein
VVTGNGERDIEQRKKTQRKIEPKARMSQWHQGTQPKTTGRKGQIPGQ